MTWARDAVEVFFKQKTAYEILRSDWSSDVCSSDLVYYLATSILGRENTSNISHYHLAFLATALNNSTKYNLGALIACRLAARGPIYGGIIAAHIIVANETVTAS